MGWFRRGPRRDDEDAPRDPEFTYFSEREAALFRRQVREAFAELGLEVTVYAGSVTDDSGRRFGLGNLAAVCHQDPRGTRIWPRLIDRHVRLVVRALEGPSALETLPPEQIRAQLYPRVVSGEGIDPGTFGYARTVGPGLYEVLALDLPESVMTLTDEALERLGDPVRLRERAIDNLRGLPVEGHETVKDADGMRFEVILGDSFYTASRVLDLDAVVRRVTGLPLTEDGALVAMPFRHQLAFHAIRDTTIVPALGAMASFAASGYEDTPGAISPYVFWWRGGTLTQLSEHAEEDGQLRIVVGDEFQALLERLIVRNPDQS
ncbi:hypothetical protein RGF97_05590 [Streptomyces roseicoloratus]|uniref:ESX secretion-associated protein EspG n=1 Tax=Streptomyces roseicoloratus TaxID=2508722 RepID=A0ABY9RR71_9ACTN|nr:hypothetical protein [Streptomyces roseicoloratus]WMX44435.1 hypothetical protein RGF97_05590 [Streptomyces roseicoloratus]